MTQKPRTFAADLGNLPKALQPLTAEKRWVVWPWELRKSKWTKPPRQACNPKCNARSNDPTTWASYADAVAAVVAGSADGIGYMLQNSQIAAADLDHVRDAQTGRLLGWAERLCVEADSLSLYREITVSGCGLRFIGLSQGRELHRKFTFNRKNGAGIELYRNTARYITISGLQEGSCEELGSIDDFLDTMLTRFNGQPVSSGNMFDFNTVPNTPTGCWSKSHVHSASGRAIGGPVPSDPARRRALRPGRRSGSFPARSHVSSTRRKMRCCCSAARSISVAAWWSGRY